MSVASDTIQVLHVDDVVDVAEVTEAYLEQESSRIEVVTAASAEEGYDLLADRDVDCVVSDYDMPGTDGIEFLEGVRERYADLPFILFTGKGSEEVASDAISAGVTDYLQKGTGSDQYTLLANRIENAVDQARAEAAAAQREQRLRTVLDNLPYPAFVVTEDVTYQLSNEAHAEFHGRAVEEIEGTDAREILSPEHYESFREDLQAVFDSDEPNHVSEVEIENSDGELGFFDSRLIPIEPVDTTKQVALGVTVDVTEKVAQRREIEANRRQLQAVVDTAPAAIFMKNRDGTYVLINEAAREWVGVDPDVPVAELSDDQLFPEETLQAIRAQDEQVFEAGEPLEYETELRLHEETRTLRIRKRPLYEDSEPHAVCAVAVDVTDREERRRELERYESMIDAIHDAACIYSADGRFEVVNDYLVDFYDEPREALVGERSPLIDRIRAERTDEGADTDPFAELVAGDREEYRGEYEVELPGHGTKVVDLKLTRLTIDGEFDGIVAIGRDVTDRRERERELERQNERLEEFSSVVSHDLRNPLNVATTRVDLARETCDSEHLPVAARSLERMGDLIDDLLSLARGGNRTVDPEPTDLEPVVRRAWNAVGSSDATLALDADYAVEADPDALRQLLANLLDNAVTHGVANADSVVSGDGDGPTVRVGTIPDEAGFFVADEGPGIPADERDEVFEAGYSTSEDGTGFGLRIVERIADSHGWDVRVAESEAGGARFEVTGVETG